MLTELASVRAARWGRYEFEALERKEVQLRVAAWRELTGLGCPGVVDQLRTCGTTQVSKASMQQ